MSMIIQFLSAGIWVCSHHRITSPQYPRVLSEYPYNCAEFSGEWRNLEVPRTIRFRAHPNDSGSMIQSKPILSCLQSVSSTYWASSMCSCRVSSKAELKTLVRVGRNSCETIFQWTFFIAHSFQWYQGCGNCARPGIKDLMAFNIPKSFCSSSLQVTFGSLPLCFQMWLSMYTSPCEIEPQYFYLVFPKLYFVWVYGIHTTLIYEMLQA